MAEFGIAEQQQLTAGLTDQQKIAFEQQYGSVKKDPTVVLILAICTGTIGVDRFFLDDMKMGLIKLFTGGGCGILWVMDIISAKERAGAYNRAKAEQVLAGIRTNY